MADNNKPDRIKKEYFGEDYSSRRMEWSSRSIGDDSITRRLAEENIERINQHLGIYGVLSNDAETNIGRRLDKVESEVNSLKDKLHSKDPQTQMILLRIRYYAEMVKGFKSFYDGKYFDCLIHFHYAIELDPEDINAWMNKAAILHDLGEYAEAIRCFDRAINTGRWRDPSAVPSAVYYRACSNVKLGNVENGLADLEEAIESDRKYIRLAKYEKNFESIRRDKRFKAILNIT